MDHMTKLFQDSGLQNVHVEVKSFIDIDFDRHVLF